MKKNITLPHRDGEKFSKRKAAATKSMELPHGTLDNLTTITREVPATEPPPLAINSKLREVGKSVRRLDANHKVTGVAKFTADISLAGMLSARILSSPHAHAKITSIDTSAAERLPGVHAVHVINVRLAGAVKRSEAGHMDVAATYNVDELPLLRFAGQPIAGVAADNERIAEDAVRLIKVTYDVRPHVVDMDKARRDGSPVVFEQNITSAETGGGGGGAEGVPLKGNVRGPATTSFYGGPRGDVAKGKAEADVVITREFRTQVQTHCPLETHGVVADWTPEGLTVYASTQETKSVRNDLAELFELPRANVRVISEYTGGGFGAKYGAGTHGVLATWLSKKTGRPVKLMLNRWEEHVSVGNRPNSWQELTIGAKKDGTLTVVEQLSYGTAGVGLGAGVGRVAQAMYDCPNFKTEQYDVMTHAGPGAAFRAPGNVQGAFAVEQVIDELAEKLDLDPIEMRRRIDPNEMRGMQRKEGLKHVDWDGRHAPGADTGRMKKGLGVGQGHWPRLLDMDSTAVVRLSGDGSVEVRSAVQDIGTGTRTILAQVVAEELGLKTTDVIVKIGDTLYPNGPASGGSKATSSITPAARNAAYQAKMRLFEEVAGEWDVEVADLMTMDGQIKTTDGSKSMAFKDALKKMSVNQITESSTRTPDYGGFEIGQFISYGRLGSVQFAEVTVDTDTGQVKVDRIVAVHSCGRPLNPAQLESQINGGVIQGVAYALYEDRVMHDGSGHQINANLDGYRLPFSREIPEIKPIIIEQYSGLTSTDAFGIAEAANVPTAAAIANAVYNAIGVRITELPITPARVLAALGKV